MQNSRRVSDNLDTRKSKLYSRAKIGPYGPNDAAAPPYPPRCNFARTRGNGKWRRERGKNACAGEVSSQRLLLGTRGSVRAPPAGDARSACAPQTPRFLFLRGGSAGWSHCPHETTPHS